MNKIKTKTVGGINFTLPFKMTKKRFKEVFGKRFGENWEDYFNELSKSK